MTCKNHRWGHIRGRPWKCLDCSISYIEEGEK